MNPEHHETHPYTLHRATIWGLCYRMTGSHADADDLTQETFTRLHTHPPNDPNKPLRPWLITVAMNLSRDALRKRKRRQHLYSGPWLPSPTPHEHLHNTHPTPNAETLYSLRESTTLAFLIALEVLTPLQRAVLILRDVLGESTTECAHTLNITPSHTKTTLHRARKRMHSYNQNPTHPSPTLHAHAQSTLGRFLQALLNHDLDTMRATLTEDVTSTSDANGQFISAVDILQGHNAILRLMVSIHTRRRSTLTGVQTITLNHLPALLLSFHTTHHRDAPFSVLTCDICPHTQRIRALYTLNAPNKIQHLRNCT